MQKYKYYFFIILIGLLLSSCKNQPDKTYQAQFYVFGTLVGISIWGVPEEDASKAVNIIIQDLQAMHKNWHAWQKSPLTDLNKALASGTSVKVSTTTKLLPLLKQAKLYSHQSDGLFNPAIGQLIRLWGFQNDDLSTKLPLPSSKKIAELVALAPNMHDIQIEGEQVSSTNPAVQLDFGAFAKGYAVNLAIDKLRKLGIRNAIINAGGNLKAIGQKGGQPWFIGIRHPSGTGVLAAIAIKGEESIITSGNYERFREYNGKHYSHIIDPRTGQPSRGLTSVTVIHPNGALADAASTALTIAGLKNWHRIAQQMEVKYVMLVDEAGTVYVNPAMAKRVQFEIKKKPKIVVSEPLK
jgi:thiamine biosynthesis lipoprotein